MGIRHDQGSAYIQERRKWETQPVMIDSQYIAPQMIDGKMRSGFMDGTYITPLSREEGGVFPFIPSEFPKMLYKAERADGGPRICEEKLTVESAQEQRNAESRGWCEGQENAIAAIKAQDLEFAKLAAERNHDVRHMSDKAKQEVADFEDSVSIHAPTVPEVKKRKYVKRQTGVE